MDVKKVFESASGKVSLFDPLPEFDVTEQYGLDHWISASSREEMNEWSLGRLYGLTDRGEKKFAIVTSWKGSYVREVSGEDDRMIRTSEEQKQMDEYNDRRYEELRSELKQMGYHPTELVGHGQEKDPETDVEYSTKERAFFVLGMTRQEAVDLGKKYNQYAIIYGGPDVKSGSGYGVELVRTEDGGTDDVGRFHPTRVGMYYSELRKLRDAEALHKLPGPEKEFTRTGKSRKFFTFDPSQVGTAKSPRQPECFVYKYTVSGIMENQHVDLSGVSRIEGIREGSPGRYGRWGKTPGLKLSFQCSRK